MAIYVNWLIFVRDIKPFVIEFAYFVLPKLVSVPILPSAVTIWGRVVFVFYKLQILQASSHVKNIVKTIESSLAATIGVVSVAESAKSEVL